MTTRRDDSSYMEHVLEARGLDMSKGTETRERIIATSAPLFNRKGFQGCSLHDIVAAAGIEKGSLYGHFANKEAVAVAAFRHAWQETCSSRTAGMSEAAGAIEKLKLHVRNAVVRPVFSGGCPLMNCIIDSDDGNKALQKEASEALHSWRYFLEEIVRHGKEHREIRADVRVEDVVAVTISLLEGAMVLDRFDKQGGYLDRAQKHVDAYLDSLVPANCATNSRLSYGQTNG